MVATLIPPVRNTSEATAMTTSTTAATSTTFNPYATSNKRQKTNIALTPSPAVTAARGNSGDQQSRREDLATIILGPRGSTTGRRFHRDKQFGCSLEIFHGDDADDDSMEDTDGTTNQTIATANSHRRIESTCHRRENSVTAADDEDDDDDALLNYVAFSKRV